MKKYRLLSLFVLIGALSLFSTGSSAQTSSTPPASSHFIPVDSANKMLRSYLNSINAYVDTGSEVQSFIMDADALREYLADNSIKKVKIMLAHTLDYINAGKSGVDCGYSAGKLTIIIVGYDADKNYIFAPGNTVLDRASPCPTQCELTGTAADMTLH